MLLAVGTDLHETLINLGQGNIAPKGKECSITIGDDGKTERKVTV